MAGLVLTVGKAESLVIHAFCLILRLIEGFGRD